MFYGEIMKERIKAVGVCGLAILVIFGLLVFISHNIDQSVEQNSKEFYS